MKISLSIGLIFCGAIMYYAMTSGLSVVSVLLNPFALFFIISGTVGYSFLVYSIKKSAEVLNFTLELLFFRKDSPDESMYEDLLLQIKSSNTSKEAGAADNHPFVSKAFEILHEKNISASEASNILNLNCGTDTRKYFEYAKVLKNLSKFNYILGLLASVVGLSVVFDYLEVKSFIDLPIILSTAFLSVFMSKIILFPLFSFLEKSGEDAVCMRKIVIEAIVLFKKGHSQKTVTEIAVSRLSALWHGRSNCEL